MHRAVPGRPRHGGHRGSRPAERPLLRRNRRRSLEDDRRRDELGSGLRQGPEDRLRGRGGRRRVGPERRLGRDGRGADPRERLARRRRLALDGRRTDVEERRPDGHAADLGAEGPPEGPRRGVGGGAGKGLGSERGARDLPDEGRREDVDARPLRRRRDGCERPRPRPVEPEDPLRRLLAGREAAVGARLGRSREQPLPVGRRWRHLDEADEGAPGRDLGKGRRRGLRGEARAASGRSSSRRRGALPVGRLRRELQAGERGERPAPAGLVLHRGLRRPEERRHGLGHERPVLEVGRRREELHLGPDAPRRQPRPLDRPRRSGSPGRGERRRRERDVRRRTDLVVDRQPADGPVLPGRRRRPLPLPRLRRAAGQLDGRHREPGARTRDRARGVARRRWLRERLDRPEAGRPGRRLRRLLRRVDHPVRPPDGRGARDHRLAAARHRPARERPEVPHPVERADPRLAARPERPLARRAGPPRVEGRGTELEGDLARPDAERQGEAGLVGRPDHEGQHRRRGLRHDLHPRRVTPREGAPLGRDGRRPRPRDARRRRDLEERDAEGAPRGDPGELDRGVPARRRDGLPGRDALQAGRLHAAPLEDGGLRRDLDTDRRRHPPRRLHARRPGGPRAARAPLRGNGDRPLRLTRRREGLDPVPAEPAGRADHRPRREGRGPRRGDAGARLLDPGRPLAAPAVEGRRGRLEAAPLRAEERRPLPGRRRSRKATEGRGAERPRGRRRLLLAEGRAEGERGRLPRDPRRREGPPPLHEREARREGRGGGGEPGGEAPRAGRRPEPLLVGPAGAEAVARSEGGPLGVEGGAARGAGALRGSPRRLRRDPDGERRGRPESCGEGGSRRPRAAGLAPRRAERSPLPDARDGPRAARRAGPGRRDRLAGEEVRRARGRRRSGEGAREPPPRRRVEAGEPEAEELAGRPELPPGPRPPDRRARERRLERRRPADRRRPRLLDRAEGNALGGRGRREGGPRTRRGRFQHRTGRRRRVAGRAAPLKGAVGAALRAGSRPFRPSAGRPGRAGRPSRLRRRGRREGGPPGGASP